MKTSVQQRILSLTMAASLLFGTVVQGGLIAYAEEEPDIATQQQTDETGTDPTDPATPTEPLEPEETTPEMVSVDITLVNSRILDAEGNDLVLPYQAESGSTLNFHVAPAAGCQLSNVKLNSITVIADEEDTMAVTVKEGLSITVTSIDVTAPQIQSITRMDAAWTSAARYTITASDNVAVKEVVVTNADGEAIPVSAAGNSYTATISANGTYTVKVTDTADTAVIHTITENKIDLTKPVISEPIRDPDSWAKSATYTFTATDSEAGVQSVKLTVDGTEKELNPNSNGTYNFTVSANGSYTITATDGAGNTVSKTITESLLDYEDPQILSVYTQEEWDPECNAVTISAADNAGIFKVEILTESGSIPAIKIADGTYTAVLSKNGNYTVLVTDILGNTSRQDFTIDHIDTDKPSIPVLTSTGEERWVNTDVTVSAVAEDSQSGIAGYWYTDTEEDFDKSIWKKMSIQEGTGTVLFRQEQDTTYRVVAEDHVGRISQEATIRVAIDKTAPETAEVAYLQEEGFNKVVDGLYIYNDTMAFHASANDVRSGISLYRYRIVGTSGNTEWVEVPGSKDGITTVMDKLENGVYVAEVQVQDLAGNWTQTFSPVSGDSRVQFALERTPTSNQERMAAPDISAKTASGDMYASQWTASNVTVTVSGSAAPSGIAGYEYMLIYADPDMGQTQWQAVPETENGYMLTFAKDLNAILCLRAVTNADNRSNVSDIEIRVQKTAPNPASISFDTATGTNGWHTKLPGYLIHLPGQGAYTAPVEYEIHYTFNGEEQTAIRYDGTNAPIIDKDGYWKIHVTAVDAAGNAAETADSTIVLRVDTEAPTNVDVLLNGSSILVDGAGKQTWEQVNIDNDIVLSYYTIYLKDTIQIRASAQGGDSAIANIYYMVLPDNAQFKIDGDWTPLTDSGISLVPNKKCNLFFKAVDNAGNTTYFSGQSIILDAQAPVGRDSEALTIQAADTNLSEHGYYYGDVTLNIHVEEPVTEPYSVFSGLTSVTYRVLKDGTVTQAGQLYPGTGIDAKLDSRVQSWDGTLVVDSRKNNSNYIVVEISAVDAAGNVKTTIIPAGQIKIDVDTPVMESSYDNNSPVSVFESTDCFTGKRTLTVAVTERNFSAAESYVKVTDTDTGKQLPYNWVSTGNRHIAVVEITDDGHYIVSALVKDLAGNETTAMNFATGTEAANKFIIDNTQPTITVSYDNNTVSQSLYFKAPRTVTVTVKERNFDPSQFDVYIECIREDGRESVIPLTKWNSNSNTHTVSFLCAENGTYTVVASGKDAAKNEAESTVYSGKAPKKFVVDTLIDAPEFTGIENNGNYAGTVVPAFTVIDKNLDTVAATLTWAGKDGKAVDVTEKMLGSINMTSIPNGKKAVLDIFPDAEDGIYTLTVSCSDKAGNSAETSITFSVNRNGSVYIYNESLTQLKGTFRQRVADDLVIIEYNPSGIVNGSERVYITRNGEPVTEPIFTVETTTTEGGWQKTIYTISTENFREDGTYTVVVSTQDAAGNVPENTQEDTAIQFSVDTTAPELTSVVGMEKKIYKADSIGITLSALDNVALDYIWIYVDGKLYQQMDGIEGYLAEMTFSLEEGYAQHIRIVVADRAGNILDTDNEGFNPGYEFQEKITVSSNFWLRFYANKPVFIGSIVAVLIAAAAVTLVLVKKQKKNKTQQ